MIGLSEILNLTNSDTGDDYEFMAGGPFDFFQAGRPAFFHDRLCQE